mgnify:CR=1 FL=1
MRIVLGVTGGIAAYKATELIRGFKALGHDVVVVPTQNALRFVGKATLEALSGNPVSDDLYENVESVQHVSIGQTADLVVVAPATASFLARYASGFADDLLGNTLLATHVPVILAPAMHSEMWQHAATVENVATLRTRGVHIIEPAVGALTSGDVGIGRLPDTEVIIGEALGTLRAKDLRGVRILITAGGTRVAIDPVRYIGNRSSGKQGIALAEAARARGAIVKLVAANIEAPSHLEAIPVTNNSELDAVIASELSHSDVLIMAAAVSDFGVGQYSAEKIKRTEHNLELELLPAEDLLAKYAGRINSQSKAVFTVGFAAESLNGEDLVDAAKAKLLRKHCDLVAANDISEGSIFGSESTEIALVDANGLVERVSGTKVEAANVILDAIAARIGSNV